MSKSLRRRWVRRPARTSRRRRPRIRQSMACRSRSKSRTSRAAAADGGISGAPPRVESPPGKPRLPAHRGMQLAGDPVEEGAHRSAMIPCPVGVPCFPERSSAMLGGTMAKGRTRLDVLLVERGLAKSRQKAAAMILAGEVMVDGQPARKAGLAVAVEAQVEVHSRLQKYASRAGLKLEGALEEFGVSPVGRVCLDVGASTGGFTDCLLQHGASRVYAVDVNTAQLAWRLQKDARVVPVEKNARQL